MPKITPERGVFQGDVLFSGNDKVKSGEHIKFKPNTITYSAHKDSEDGKKIKRAKFGIYNHTEYVGGNAKAMTANYSPELEGFKDHPDVYHRKPGHDTSKVKMKSDDHFGVAQHLADAHKIHDKHGDYMYDAVSGPIKDHIKTYINSTVDSQEMPSVKGLQSHLEKKYTKEIDKKKTEAGKKKWQDELSGMIKHTQLHKQNIENVFAVHHHLQKAKDILVRVLSQHTGGLDHEIRGEKVKPEGFVVNHNGKLSKLNDRNEFNRLNRLARAK